MGYIYKVTNTVNGKVYIGQTIRTIPIRWGEHIKYSFVSAKGKSYNSILHCAIRKYGVESFTVEEVEQCGDELLAERETYWIQYYDSTHKGYNINLGSKGFHKCTDEDILKEWNDGKSLKQIAKTLPLHPDTISARLRRLGISKQELLDRGNKVANNAKKRPVYQYDLNGNFIKEFSSRREAQKCAGTWINLSENAYGRVIGGYQWRSYKTDNIGVCACVARKLKKQNEKPKKPHLKKVAQLSIDGRYIQSFSSIKEAAKAINGNDVAIGHTLAGRSKSSGGFRWMYLEDAKKLGVVS